MIFDRLKFFNFRKKSEFSEIFLEKTKNFSPKTAPYKKCPKIENFHFPRTSGFWGPKSGKSSPSGRAHSVSEAQNHHFFPKFRVISFCKGMIPKPRKFEKSRIFGLKRPKFRDFSKFRRLGKIPLIF